MEINEAIIDRDVFEQVLEMDEGNDRSFSMSLVQEFFEQAEDTFAKMQDTIQKKDLHTLSRLGHFLKGSSAALGIRQLRATCERIQYTGEGKGKDGSVMAEEQALVFMPELIQQARQEYEQAKSFFQGYYGTTA